MLCKCTSPPVCCLVILYLYETKCFGLKDLNPLRKQNSMYGSLRLHAVSTSNRMEQFIYNITKACFVLYVVYVPVLARSWYGVYIKVASDSLKISTQNKETCALY